MISTLVSSSPETYDPIEYNEEVLEYFEEKFLPGLRVFQEDARSYCEDRDKSYGDLLKIKNSVEHDLNKLFAGLSVTIQLMSSFGSRMYLKGHSDIDFAVLVPSLREKSRQMCIDRLVNAGYKCNGFIYGYTSCVNIVKGIEIEVKIRDMQKSLHIIKLHECLDSLELETQQLLTYAKYVTKDNSPVYNKLKSIIYSAYYTGINL